MRMTFSSLEDHLIHEVIRGPLPLAQLRTVATTRYSVSRAGFYKALAALKQQEVLIEHGHMISVNTLWLSEAYRFFEGLVEYKRTAGYLAQEVMQLTSGEELSYTFRSIGDIDLFLINIVYDLLLLGLSTEVLIEESHEFFLLLNRGRTDSLLREMRRHGYGLYLLIASTSPIDRILAKKFVSEPAQAFLTNKSRLNRKILHVIGDVIIELQLHRDFAHALDSLYTSYDTINHSLNAEVHALAAKSFKHRIRIFKHASLAARVRTRCKKYFVLA